MLLAAVDHAAATGFDTHTWQLAWTLTTFLDRRGHWHDRAATQQRRRGRRRSGWPTRPRQAHAHRGLARAYTRLGRYDDAHTHLRHALDLYRRAGDQAGQAHTHLNLGLPVGAAGPPPARPSTTPSRPSTCTGPPATGAGRPTPSTRSAGATPCSATTSRPSPTASRPSPCTRSSATATGRPTPGTASATPTTTSATTPRPSPATSTPSTLFRDLGDRYDEADTLTHLGDTHHAAGDPDAARDAWQQALTILDELDHPDADQVRAKLGGLTVPTGDRADE